MQGPRDTHMRYEWGSLYKAIPCLPRTPETASKVYAELRAAAEEASASDEDTVPAAVIRRAVPEGSLLHGFFDWNDTDAAKLWRIEQARDLLRGVKVVNVTVLSSGAKVQTAPIPVFASVRLAERRGYRETMVLVDTTSGREALLREAAQQLAQFRSRYAALVELTKVMSAIEQFLRKDKAA